MVEAISYLCSLRWFSRELFTCSYPHRKPRRVGTQPGQVMVRLPTYSRLIGINRDKLR